MKTFAWILLFAFSLSSTAFANPTFSRTEAGDIRIDEQGPVYNIYSADRSIGAFQSFGNLAGETINSIQPSADNSVIFKVVGGQPSEFFGALNANSRVFLVNPNGILFGAGSQVNAPGLVASALDLKSANFDAREFLFERSLTGSGYILNDGTLRASEGGYVALLGAAVENRGTIMTPGGSTLLDAGSAATVALDNDGAISVAVTKPVEGAVYDLSGNRLKNGILNSGLISAAGGLVYLSASAMDSVFDQVLNLGGVVEANTVQNRGGKIILDGGDSGIVAVTGQIEARGEEAGENGGEIRVLGDKVAILDTAKLDASGFSGGFIELSGDQLVQRGSLDVSSHGGEAGTLYYDPLVIQIIGGVATDGSDSDVSVTSLNNGTLGSVFFGDTPSPFLVYESEIEATNANIILEARQSITTSGTFNSTDLLIMSNRSLTLKTQNNAVDGAGSINLNSSSDGSNLLIRTQGTGDINILGSTGGTLKSDIFLPKLRTDTGDILIDTNNGNITLTNDIQTNGGDVTIDPGIFSTDRIVIQPAASPLTIDTLLTGSTAGDVDLNGTTIAGAASVDLVINTSGFSGTDNGGDVSLDRFAMGPSGFLNDLTISAKGFGAGLDGSIFLSDRIDLGDYAADTGDAQLGGGTIDMQFNSGIFTPDGNITLNSDDIIYLSGLDANSDFDTVFGNVSLTSTLSTLDRNAQFTNIIGNTVSFTTPSGSIGTTVDPLEVGAASINTTGVAGGAAAVHLQGPYMAPPPPPGDAAGVIITGGKITGGDNFQQFLTASTTVTDPSTTTESQTEEKKEQEGDRPAYVTPGAALPPPPLVAPPPTFQQEAPVDAGTFAPCPA